MAKIYFTDLSDYKIRPVLIIKELDDHVCLQITTNAKGMLIRQQDLIKGSLKKDFFIVVPKNFTLHKNILIKYLATLKPEAMVNVIGSFCKAMGCT